MVGMGLRPCSPLGARMLVAFEYRLKSNRKITSCHGIQPADSRRSVANLKEGRVGKIATCFSATCPQKQEKSHAEKKNIVQEYRICLACEQTAVYEKSIKVYIIFKVLIANSIVK